MPLPGTTGAEKTFAKESLRASVFEAPVLTATAVAGAATLNSAQGVITSESLSTAAGLLYTLTLTNSLVSTTDLGDASVSNGTNTAGVPAVATVSPGGGVLTVVIQNIQATAAFNGTIKIAFQVIKNFNPNQL